jgi:hypothetical protein
MRLSLSALPRTAILAAGVFSALPALAEDKGHLVFEQKIGSGERAKLRNWLDLGEQVRVHCNVTISPGPRAGSVFQVDHLAKEVAGSIRGLDSQDPKFVFGPFPLESKRTLEYGATADSTVELMVDVEIRSSHSERLPCRYISAMKTFSPGEFSSFLKMVETQGVLLSAGTCLMDKSSYAPLAAALGQVESKGAGAEEKKSS